MTDDHDRYEWVNVSPDKWEWFYKIDKDCKGLCCYLDWQPVSLLTTSGHFAWQ